MAGLGARDSLRLEAGLCLYGNDIDQNTLPPSAVLLFTVPKKRRADGNFPGCAHIIQQQKEKPEKKRVGLIFEAGKSAPRQVIILITNINISPGASLAQKWAKLSFYHSFRRITR